MIKDYANGNEPSDKDVKDMDKINRQTYTQITQMIDRKNPDECKRFGEKFMGMYKNSPAIEEIRKTLPKRQIAILDKSVSQMCKDLISGNIKSSQEYFKDSIVINESLQEAYDVIDSFIDKMDD